MRPTAPITPTTWKAAGLALVLLSACGADGSDPGFPAETGPERVVVLVIDALNAEHLGSYDPRPNRRIDLTPNLDAIAAEGRRFTSAISNSTWTLPSTASLMTGMLQEHHEVTRREGVVPEEAELLSERFQADGWTTQSFVQMTYASRLYGFDQGFDATREYGFGGGPPRARMAAEVLDWMETHADERYFLYLHFRRPHGVYNAPLAVRAEVMPNCELAGTERGKQLEAAQDFAWTELPEAERRHVRHLYRANLAAVDRTLGPILDAARGDGTLLVVTSDHGEGLGEHGFYGHGPSVHRENLHIPLIYRGPAVAVGVDAGPASTVDLWPTLVELCELPVPDELWRDGRSLVARLAGRGSDQDEPTVHFSGRYGGDAGPAMGFVRAGRTYFVDAAGQPHVFAQDTDPGELDDLWASAQGPAVFEGVVDSIRARRARFRHLGELPSGAAPELSEADKADLRALGYAGD